MSRIGKQPIVLPDGVNVEIADGRITMTGPKGTLAHLLRSEITVRLDGRTLIVEPVRASRKASAYWGLTRAILARMAEGVARAFEKRLLLEGIGYRAALDGSSLVLNLGFSHPVRIDPKAGITFHVEKNAIVVSGPDLVAVGDAAARIRAARPPEPYKGKGIRYAGEIIRRKAGKKAVAAGG